MIGQVEKAREMREAGATLLQIGEAVGRSPSTILRWLNPEAAEKTRQQSREAKRRRQIATCADCGEKLSYDCQENERCWACEQEYLYGERNRRIFKAWEERVPTAEIAEAEGMAKSAVQSLVDHHRRLHGKPLSLHRARNRTNWEAIQQLWKAGLTSRAIGEQLGISAHNVEYQIQYMRKQGIDIPRRYKTENGKRKRI